MSRSNLFLGFSISIGIGVSRRSADRAAIEILSDSERDLVTAVVVRERGRRLNTV